MNDYKPRVADSRLTDLLDAMGAVLIEGPKYCGKTTLAEQHSGSILYMADPEIREQNITMAQSGTRSEMKWIKEKTTDNLY